MKDKQPNMEAVKVYDDLRERLSKTGFAVGHCELHINKTSGYVMHIEFDITPEVFDDGKVEAQQQADAEREALRKA